MKKYFFTGQWSLTWEEEVSHVLLQKMAEHWMKLRGFSFASALVEKHKQSKKANLQKSKGLRKQLETPGSRRSLDV